MSLLIGLRKNMATDKLDISTLVISDVERFAKIKDFWDQEIKKRFSNPFLFSSLLIELWKYRQQMGDCPFLMIFTSKKKIVGFAPLVINSSFGFRRVASFDIDTHLEVFEDKIREKCIDITLDFIFNRLRCRSADFTLGYESSDHIMLMNIYEKKGLKYSSFFETGQAVIPVKTSWSAYRQNLKSKDLRHLDKVKRRIDGLGPCRVCSSEVNSDSLKKIWTVENHSWKSGLRGKERALKDLGLDAILRGVQRSLREKVGFETKVWTLELNGAPIAYILTMQNNGALYLAKTSYDMRYSSASPGLFLFDDLICQVFNGRTAETIDFITDFRFSKFWRPLVYKRITVRVVRGLLYSKVYRCVFENRVCYRSLKVLEQVKWEKIMNNRYF